MDKLRKSLLRQNQDIFPLPGELDYPMYSERETQSSLDRGVSIKGGKVEE